MGESHADVVDMLLELREIAPQALPINFLLPIPGTPLEHTDTSGLTTEYCLKVLCLARLMVPQTDLRCAAGREVYFKGREGIFTRRRLHLRIRLPDGRRTGHQRYNSGDRKCRIYLWIESDDREE